MNILTINLALSTLVFWIAARLYVLPKLQDYEARAILLPILLLHSLRHLGRPLRDRRKAVFLSHSHRPGCPLLARSGHWRADLVLSHFLSASLLLTLSISACDNLVIIPARLVIFRRQTENQF